ncbi:MAG: hypothetical protein JXB88_21270 [Spirochaetales bacterium]|nr:hypothetical protein [Spirochaetales bacterium]
MEKHHQEAINIFLDRYKHDGTVLAILLGGSIAHGFSVYDSDIDLSIIVSEKEFRKRKNENNLAFSIRDICSYENGYIDCKVADIDFLKKISIKGSDPARYAYKDNILLYSKIDNLQKILTDISMFPVDKIEERRNRFASQLLAWKWYYSEGVKKGNNYLEILALQKIVLFSCRIILNENQLLYPYHKWMLKVLETAKNKPQNILDKINTIIEKPSMEIIDSYCKEILSFIDFTEKTIDWPNYFLQDSEQNWIEHEAPVDDI